MGNALSASGSASIQESKTEARKVVAAFMLEHKGDESACRRMELTIDKKEVVIAKPQWEFARPYFAMDVPDDAPPKYGTLGGWYRTLPKNQQEFHRRITGVSNILYAPPSRWAHASSFQAAGEGAYLNSMTRMLTNQARRVRPATKLYTGRDGFPNVTFHMMWPADRHVYEVPDTMLTNAVTWNKDYSPEEPPFLGVGRPVLQHGSVLLEPKPAGAAFTTDKLDKIKPTWFGANDADKPRQIVSRATLVPPEPFLHAMQTGAHRVSLPGPEDAAETRRQRAAREKGLQRWIVLVGGAHPHRPEQHRQASVYFQTVAFYVGKALADNWPTLRHFFAGIVTASGAGLGDSVTWDEEVSRGVCSVSNSQVPIYHIRDLNQVAVDGMCCDVPYGHGVVLNSPDWKDDWSGNNRDLVLSLLAQGGLVIYGGLPGSSPRPDTALLERAVYRYSMLPPRPPLMSVVIAGAGAPGDILTLTGESLAQFARRADIPSDRVFAPLRSNVERLATFVSPDNLGANLRRVSQAIPGGTSLRRPDDGEREWDDGERERERGWDDGERERERERGDGVADVFFDPAEAADDRPDGEPSWFGGGDMQAKEMASRLPIVYTTPPYHSPQSVAPRRVMLNTSQPYAGFGELYEQTHGSMATEKSIDDSVRIYASNAIGDVSKRVADHFRRQSAAQRR